MQYWLSVKMGMGLGEKVLQKDMPMMITVSSAVLFMHFPLMEPYRLACLDDLAL